MSHPKSIHSTQRDKLMVFMWHANFWVIRTTLQPNKPAQLVFPSFSKCTFPQAYLVSACTGAISIDPTPRPEQISCISQSDSVFRPAQTARHKYHMGPVHLGSKQNHSENSGLRPHGIQPLCPHFHPKNWGQKWLSRLTPGDPNQNPFPVNQKLITSSASSPSLFLILQWLH